MFINILVSYIKTRLDNYFGFAVVVDVVELRQCILIFGLIRTTTLIFLKLGQLVLKFGLIKTAFIFV